MTPLVVLPTFNEAETIEEVLRRSRSALPEAHFLVVDDGSPDGTADVAERVRGQLGGIDIMRRPTKGGLGDAYRAGFAWGFDHGADPLIEMDSDLSHDPAALPDLVAGLADHDLVIGSRYVPGGSIPEWGLHRLLLSRAANKYSQFMLGVNVQDLTSGFRGYRARLLKDMRLESVRADGYAFQVEMTYRAAQAGARIVEIPITFVDRAAGRSKMSSSVVVEALILVTQWGVVRQARRVWSRLRRTADQARPDRVSTYHAGADPHPPGALEHAEGADQDLQGPGGRLLGEGGAEHSYGGPGCSAPPTSARRD